MADYRVERVARVTFSKKELDWLTSAIVDVRAADPLNVYGILLAAHDHLESGDDD